MRQIYILVISVKRVLLTVTGWMFFCVDLVIFFYVVKKNQVIVSNSVSLRLNICELIKIFVYNVYPCDYVGGFEI